MSATALAALAASYMGALFLIAYAVDRSNGVARELARHPMTHALALGTYATSWVFFGTIGAGAIEGFRFLAVDVGPAISCGLFPWVWAPLLRLCKDRQLASAADLLAFRYCSRTVGVLVTLFLLAGSLPYQALQLRAAVESVAAFGGAGPDSKAVIAAIITLFLVTFALVYGVRHLTPAKRHDGFVAALAFESIVKLLALLALGGYCLFGVLDGIEGLDRFLAERPEIMATMMTPARDQSWTALLTISIGSVFLVPRQWHIAFNEGSSAGVRMATWMLPAYLLLMMLPIPLLLFAARRLGLTGSHELYMLALCRASGSAVVATVAFLGVLSASSAMIVATTVALASMMQNQLILPFISIRGGDLYKRLRWLRRSIVIVIVLSGHAAYALFGDGIRLVDLGLASVVAVAQVMPALTGVLFWPRATARGAAAGLAAGIIAWIATPVVPLLADAGVLPRAWSWLAQLGVSDDPWTFTTALTLGVNTCAFVVASLWREASQDERDAAQICMRRSNPPLGDVVGAGSAGEFENRLSHALGKDAAAQELDRALAQLGLLRDARRPEELLALREQLEKNLSGLLGPVKARRIVDEQLALRRSLREMQAMAEHQNRLAVIGRFAAGVAHEIGNPIIAIASIAHDLKTMIERAEPRRALDQLLGEAKRIERIIRSLVAFAHDGQMTVAMQPTVIEAAHLVDEAVTVARLGRASRNVSVETHIQPDLIMRGDRQRLEQVLINLITNACDASEDGAVVQIHARACDASVQFRVVDRGVGMTKEVRDLAFEPFFTTKPPGAGTGLGLPLAYGIVAEHGGSIAIESQPGGGTTVIVELPI